VVAPVPWVPQWLSRPQRWQKYTQTPAQATIDGITVYYPRYIRPPGAWFRGLSGLSMYYSIRGLVRRLHHRQKFDLINSHTIFPAGHAGLLLGRHLDLPTVCVLHGSDLFVHPFENKLTRRVATQVLSQTDQLVTVSQALRAAVKQLATPGRPVRVIYNGVDTHQFRPSNNAAQIRQKLGLPLQVPVILFVGRDLKQKGLPTLLAGQDIIKRNYPHSKLIVVGADKNQLDSLDPALIKKAGPWLVVAGVRPPEEMPLWMNASDLLVLPSRSEGLGCVLLEAAACQRATIGVRVGGIQEAIEHNVTGLLVDNNRPDDLANAIVKLLDNPEQRANMGLAGYRRVLSKFQWSHNAHQTIELYRQLCNDDR